MNLIAEKSKLKLPKTRSKIPLQKNDELAIFLVHRGKSNLHVSMNSIMNN